MASKLLLLGLLLNLLIVKDVESAIGVCNGRNGNDLPSEEDVVSLYKSNGITKMRIYDPPFTRTLTALKGSNIEVMIGVRNDHLERFTDPNFASMWVRDNIQSYPEVRFKYIAVGNEVDPNKESGQYKDFLLPALQNVYNATRAAGLGDQIKVSTATYSGLLNNTYPPSNGEFLYLDFIEPIIGFLAQYNQPLLANVYPYFSEPGLNLPYALFTASKPGATDNKGRQYYNLFDAIIDAYYAALARLGVTNVDIVVSETGWASAGGDPAIATLKNAETYYKNLIAHVNRNAGTPLKPGRSIETYLFAMFDENLKDGNSEEQHFGIFTPGQQPKYGELSFN